jgi:hypothetical protein
MAISAFNEVARQVKGDGYNDGDCVELFGEYKTDPEVYVDLDDIRRRDETNT